MSPGLRSAALAAVAGWLSLVSPAATVTVDPDCADMGTVSWSERSLGDGNSRLTLKATAADGYAFAGWLVSELDVVDWPDDWRHPGSTTVTVISNAEVVAEFINRADDQLSFDISESLTEEIAADESFFATLSVDSESFPQISFRNLPPGIAFDERTLSLSGTPREPGRYQIVADAVNASGFKFRSLASVRVANLTGARVSGEDVEIPTGEYFYTAIGDSSETHEYDPTLDIFHFDEPPSSVTLKGTVPGLEWNEEWRLLYGTPTVPGEYTLRVTAAFPTGAVETATLMLTVSSGTPEDYGFSLDFLSNLQIGDELDESYEIGEESSDVAVRRVSGLPTGLKSKSRFYQGARHWSVEGTLTEPGFFNVTLELDDLSGETQRVVTVGQTVAVADVPNVYLAVTSADVTKGTVSGGGAVSPIDEVTLVATPRSQCVFAGWYDADGERIVFDEGVDYRSSEVTLPSGTDFSFLAPVAHFVDKADDAAPDLSELEDAEFSFAPYESSVVEFEVESLSLPTLTFKGLPRGVSCAATGAGGFALTYDPDTAVANSGRYTVTVTAVNVAGRKSTAAFRVIIEPVTDERIDVYDDYGEFSVGEEIDPIDLSTAVDFANGETLSVSGLPKGLAYNAKAKVNKGIEAYTITGTPTVPGDYTLTFSARVIAETATNRQGKVTYRYETATATAFLTVLPYPELAIDVDEDAADAGCRVSGAGNYPAGKKVTLKATVPKGWVFAGWDGLDDLEGLAALNPQVSYVTGTDDVWAQALFAKVSEDRLFIAAPGVTSNGFAAEWPLNVELDEDDSSLLADLIETVSWPTVKVDGLPSGVKFNASTFQFTGTPKKSGVYHLTVTAKNAGGYAFVRVLDIAVLNADGSLPTETPLANPAEIDFAPLKGLMTGVNCPTGAVALTIGPKPGTKSSVTKVAVSGLPSGLRSTVALAESGASVEVTGTPTKPGRQVVTVTVGYADGKSFKSQAAVVVEDGGSGYLFVTSSDAAAGSVSGEGVYAAGATVKLVAKAMSKQVFAGWQVADDESDWTAFTPIRDLDGIDPRTASVAFPFRHADFPYDYELLGVFASVTDDAASTIDLEAEVWEIDPTVASSFGFSIDSLSVPKVTVTGLPKGVAIDAARGRLQFTPNADTQPGIYAAKVSAKNASQKQATVRTLEIRVANRVSSVIEGLYPDMDAYPISVGTTVSPELIAPKVDAAWKLTAKGLPSGLSFKNGIVTGVASKAGNYTVTFTATTGKGKTLRTEIATITIRVTALPMELTGTFFGMLTDSEEVAGTVTIVATAAGKVSLSAKTPAKSVSLTAKSWDVFTNEVATVSMSDKKDNAAALKIVDTDDWQAWQASGTVQIADRNLEFTAQRNPYGTKDGNAEARECVAKMVGNSELNGLKFKLNAKGTVTFSGKYNGKSLSGSSVLQWTDDTPISQYVKFPDKKSLIYLIFEFDEDGKVISWE